MCFGRSFSYSQQGYWIAHADELSDDLSWAQNRKAVKESSVHRDDPPGTFLAALSDGDHVPEKPIP